MLILQVIIFSLLLSITYQDFKFRAVYWWLFVLLLIGLSINQSMAIGFARTMKYMALNCVFLASQLLCLTVYLSIKERRAVNLFNGYFGIGDLFFLIGTSVYFSFLNFVVYYALSLVAVILIAMITGMLSKQHNQKIPLAGYQAMVLLCLMMSAHFFGTDWGSDQWLSNFING